MGSALFPKFLGAAFSITKSPQFNSLIQESASGKELRLALQSMPRWNITLTYEYLYARQRYLASNQVPDSSALIDPANLVANDWAALAGFFAARQGAFDDFLLDDQDEDPIIAAVNGSIGTGDGSTLSFQLQRRLGSFNENVQNVNGTPVQPSIWTPSRVNATNDLILPTASAIVARANRQPSIQSAGWPCYFKCITAGTSASVEPNWRSAPLAGQSVADGSAVWSNQGAAFVLYVNGVAQAPSAYTLGATGLVTFVATPSTGAAIAWTGDFYTRVRFAQDSIDFEEFYYQFWQAKKVELVSVKL
jgi:hypothetical protein